MKFLDDSLDYSEDFSPLPHEFAIECENCIHCWEIPAKQCILSLPSFPEKAKNCVKFEAPKCCTNCGNYLWFNQLDHSKIINKALYDWPCKIWPDFCQVYGGLNDTNKCPSYKEGIVEIDYESINNLL